MYDSDLSVVAQSLAASNSTVFSSATLQQILTLSTKNDAFVSVDTVSPNSSGQVTVASGAEVVMVASSDTFQTTLTPPSKTPVVIFQGKGGVAAVFNDAAATVPSANQTSVDRIVVGTAGSDKIVVADAKNTKIVLGSGNSTVQTGHGVDTVEAGLGNSTIVGGTGDYAVVKLAGSPTNYTVAVENGHAVVTNKATQTHTDVSKIQYVQLDQGQALVFAKDSVEAAVSTLYQTMFGRAPDAGGLNYWFDLAKAGATLPQIANAFAHSAEFTGSAAQDNATYIMNLYQNTFGRLPDSGGFQYWMDALAHGQTRGDLAAAFSYVAGQNFAGASHTEPHLVGDVTVITNII